MAIMTPLNPASPQAADIVHLFIFAAVVAVIILAIVSVTVIISIVRFRHKPGQGDPPQNFGNEKLEVIWTVLPAITLTVMFFYTAYIMHEVDPNPPPGRKPDVVVTAHQWWWDFELPASGAVTANELHIPDRHDLLFEIRSADVIHDFWVPRLGQKMDAIPNHPNYVWYNADAPGLYLGTCAEFCGAEHAWMRIRVYVEEETQFQDWVKNQLKEAAPPSSPEAERGEQLFLKLTCASCHTIRGIGASGGVGPPLTHVASRHTLGAGVIENTPANLRRWLTDPQAIKPGCHMPNLQLPKAEVDELAAYLGELK